VRSKSTSARLVPAVLAAASFALAASPARAAGPSTAECLAASDASISADERHALRAERAQLLVCAAPSCPADIRKECARRVDEVNARMPTLIFAARDAAGADLVAVRVTMDGEPLADKLEGTAIPVDPGEHTFAFETAGQPAVTKKLVVQVAQKDRHELVVIGPPAAPAAPAAPPPSTPAATPLSAAPESHGLGTQRVLAVAAGGLGVIGVGVGVAFGVMAIGQKNDAQNACPNNPCATQDGANKWSSAGVTGNVATIAVIAGGVALAGGAVLWLTAPRAAGPGAQVGLGPGGVALRGTW
jgi:hypothetical protein